MMVPGLVAIPAEDDRDDAPRTHHVTKRDLKSLVIFLIVFAIITYPLYGFYKRRADSHTCAANMNAVYQACSLYATANDDRFPPLVQQNAGSPGAPYVEGGKVITWVTDVFPFDQSQNPSHFQCPAASESETTPTEGAVHRQDKTQSEHITIHSSYGMYAPYSASSTSMIDRGNQVIFLSETSNFGSEGSYDPLPFLDPNGKKIPYDGFSIGYNDSNIEPSATSKRVTRLAFRDSAKGPSSSSVGRHQEGLHAITPDGNLLFILPGEIDMHTRGGLPVDRWQAPAYIAH